MTAATAAPAPEVVACTPQHTLKDGEVLLLGAVDNVTGAMTRVEMKGTRLLIDCGIGQGREARSWTFPEAARDIDAVVLTHGHHDHIGSLPTLLEHGFDKPIVATRATLDIARISLEDSLGMQRVPDRDIARFMLRFDKLARPIAYDQLAQHVPAVRAKFAFRDAGHILGSASVEIVSDESRVVCSGDLGRPGTPILRDANTTWSSERPVDLVIMESTYGGRDHEHDHGSIEETLLRVLQNAIKHKQRVLIPSFAIGRTQTLLWFLNDLVEKRKLPPIPVALDTPMGFEVTETYDKYKRLFDRETLDKVRNGDDPLDFRSLFISKRGKDSARLRDLPNPLVIIAGSGMCSGGRIVGHLLDGLGNDDTVVLFAGHQAVGTPGRRIQEAAKDHGTVRLDGQEVMVRARIETLRGLSAHADRGELRDWLHAIPGVARCGLHHGERDAQEAFVAWHRGDDDAEAPAPTTSHAD